MMMNLVNSVLNFVVPPASLLMLAFSWPALSFINTCEWIYNSFFGEDMEDKVVIITGASSGIGEQIAYEYAKKKAHLVLVARRENRLWAISENARTLGAKSVLITAADVVKEADCRKFITKTVNLYGRGYQLLGKCISYLCSSTLPEAKQRPNHSECFSRELVALAKDELIFTKAALVNFYETLRFEVDGDIGVTIATHGWIGTEMTGGRFMLEEGAEMQWKEERELLLAFSFKVHASGSSVEDFAKLIVSGACRGDPYVKYPSWYDIFLLYRVFTPNVLQWTFRMLLANQGARRTSLIGTGRPLLESSSPRIQPLPETSSPPQQSLSETSSPRRQPLSGSSSPQHPSSSPRRRAGRVGPVPVQPQME
ncbi:hypothetical protein RND71_005980 [Anisodus tanguticus]|uniref:Uncharacterized protein n=1 Tax=Anisodus tanguticus TaxID=243964 RepID=A0AAE1STG9_9SOLA|nr:hypothetical protein RND71_005980 [Anisodus tanguticus]